MKKKLWRILPLFLLLSLLVCGCSEKEGQGEQSAAQWVEYDMARLDEYVALDAYVGLTVTVNGTESSRGEAVWQAVLERARILSYPQEQVEYYVEQERAKNRYLGETVSEEVLLETAKELVKADLVYAYIVRETGMTLTEEERATLYDRYVERYVETYGYSKEYVKDHMSELVYESMLFDKTMEYLILNNTVIQTNP